MSTKFDTNTPLVSVLCIVKNRIISIRRCLDSIIKQTYTNLEIIIQDGASTDGTLEVLKEYAERDKRIKMVSEIDIGVGDATFKALNRVKGEIFIFCLSDDELLPHAVKWGVEQLQECPECAAVYGDCYCTDIYGNIKTAYRIMIPWSVEKYLCCELVPPLSSSFFRTCAFHSINLKKYTGIGCGEYELWLRLGLKYPIKYIPEFLSKFAHHENSSTCNSKSYWDSLPYRIDAVKRVLSEPGVPDEIVKLKDKAICGIHLWMAESFLWLGHYNDFEKMIFESLKYPYDSQRFYRVINAYISKRSNSSDDRNLKDFINNVLTQQFTNLICKFSDNLLQISPLVSIITICLNAMPHIKDCIESILAQDYPNIEYIIQDGGSTDGTVELIKQYAEKYPDKIKWASEKDSGHGEAMNRALQRCTGEIIGTCNADDMLMPYAVRWAVESFDADHEVGAIYGDYVEIDERGNTRSLVTSGPKPYNYERIICVEDVIPMQSAFFRRSALQEAGFLDGAWLPRHCEDFAIWVRLGLSSEIKQIPCFVSKYRIHKGSETNTPKVYKKFYIAKREVLERFFLDPQVPQSIKALRNRAIGGLALSIAWMFLIHFGNVQEAFRYIRLARAEQPDNAHLSHMGQTIKKWDFALSQIIKYAQDLFNSQRFQEAYAVFDFLTPIDLWYPGLHYLRAVCLQLLGRNTDALLALKREFELHPDFDVPNPEFFGLERG